MLLGFIFTHIHITAGKNKAAYHRCYTIACLMTLQLQFLPWEWGWVCTFTQPRWHHQSHAGGCSALSRSAAVTRNILEFFSLRFTTFVYQPLAEVTISSAKKCCFPKSFGRVSQRFVFLLLPNLETVFKGGEKKIQPDKPMREETNSDVILHFFPRTF